MVEFKQYLIAQSLGKVFGEEEADGREAADVGSVVRLGPLIRPPRDDEVLLRVG